MSSYPVTWVGIRNVIAYLDKFSIPRREKLPFQVLVLRELEPEHHVHLWFFKSVSRVKRHLHAAPRKGGTRTMSTLTRSQSSRTSGLNLWVSSKTTRGRGEHVRMCSANSGRRSRNCGWRNVRSAVRHRCSRPTPRAGRSSTEIISSPTSPSAPQAHLE